MNLIDKWIDWNNKKISGHDFCMEFEASFRTEIRARIKEKSEGFKKAMNDEGEPRRLG